MFLAHARLRQTATFFVLVSAIVAATQSSAQETTDGISPSARTYLEQALDLMQKNALNAKSIDWTQVRRETILRGQHAKNTFDTYSAIAYALAQLKESHSWLQLPDSFPAEQKQTVYAEIAKVMARPEADSKPSPFAPSKEIQGHIDHRNGKVFAHVILPMCVPRYSEWEKNAPDFQQFAEKLHSIVIDLQTQKPNGWIIDLRGNGGGNMWPMLAGIGPVLGEGDLGAFESPTGDRETWFYKGGKAGTRAPQQQEEISANVTQPPFTLPDLPLVALLLDRGTGSSAPPTRRPSYRS